jgi:hypothetical protein
MRLPRQHPQALQSDLVKLPRISIAALMTLVVFVAANCAILKGIMARPSVWNEVFILGVLPMANLLAIGLLPGLQRQRARSRFGGFRAGFEVCGGLAMVTFLALSLKFTDLFFHFGQSWFQPYLVLTPGLGLVSAVLLAFLGPQLAFAVLGGWLGRLISSKLDQHAMIASQADGD